MLFDYFKLESKKSQYYSGYKQYSPGITIVCVRQLTKIEKYVRKVGYVI